VRLGAAIDAVGAKRVVIDTIETMFGVFTNTAVLRFESRRLFGWIVLVTKPGSVEPLFRVQ
jgi:circadian clock protein KaiC